MADREVYGLITAEKNLSVDVCIKGTHINSLVMKYGERDILTAITGAIIMAGEYFNVKDGISEAQAVQTASLFIGQFPMETFEDLILCLKNAKLGKYGKVYNRLDGQIIFEWFRLYLDEKYERFEQIKKQEKEQYQAETMESFAPILSKLIAELESKNEQEKAEEKLRSKRVSAEKHFKQFSEVVPEFSKEELKEFLQYYKKQNELSVGDQFQHYVELLQSTLNNLK